MDGGNYLATPFPALLLTYNNEEPEELIRYAALKHNPVMTATLQVTPTLISNHF
jgi:serine kinase of HPr protein (carbohydrate metabolism regulator)